MARQLKLLGCLMLSNFLLWTTPSYAASKALVVGIKDYNYWSRLQNSRNDAEDMAQALKNLGFDTTLIIRDVQLFPAITTAPKAI